jgi:hypothetical protein
VALTSVLEDSLLVGAVRAGAIGYLLKDAHADELCRAIKSAAAGQVHLAPQAAMRLMQEVRTPVPRREDCQDPRQQYFKQTRRTEPDAGRSPRSRPWLGLLSCFSIAHQPYRRDRFIVSVGPLVRQSRADTINRSLRIKNSG